MAKKKQFSFDPVASDKPENTDVLTAEITDESGKSDTFWLSSGEIRDSLTSPLNDYETERLTFCEEVIREGKQVFINVASALLEINQNKLYRATYKTFEEYCQQKFQFSRSRAYQLMDMAEVAQTLSLGSTSNEPAADIIEQSISQINTFPEIASHFTALKEVAPEKRKEVWEAVVNESKESGKNITAKQIGRVNERLTGKMAKNKSTSKVKSAIDNDFLRSSLEPIQSAELVSNRTESLSVLGKKHKDEIVDGTEQSVLMDGGEESDSSQLVGKAQEKVSNENEGEFDRGQLIEKLRSVIKRSRNHQILLSISGEFIIGNGLSRTWCLLRNIPIEEIDNSFTDLITYEQACEFGII